VSKKIHLRYYREVNDFRQQDLADKVGITKQNYSEIENGNVERINPQYLVEWAAMLNVSVDELLTGKRASHT